MGGPPPLGAPPPAGRPTLCTLKGVPVASWMLPNWSNVESFSARSDDLIIATYPKAGTTWMQEIVDLIRMEGDERKCKRAPVYDRIPFLEIISQGGGLSGTDQIERLDPPRVIKTHLPVQLVPQSVWDMECKVIVVARNAKDCAVSYFHFHRMNQMLPTPGTWNEFLTKFIQGQVSWGPWSDHVCGWWNAKDKYPILYLLYEDIKENPRREIEKVAQFLSVELDNDQLDKVVQNSTFSVMRDNPMANYTTLPSTVFDQSISRFMRKGEVGDWKNHFTVAQNEKFEEDYRRRMSGTGLRFRETL